VTAAPPRLTVELTTALSLASAPGVVRWVEGKPVVRARVVVQGTPIAATTDARGRAQLAIVAPVTGRVLEIDAASAQVSSGPAGPSHGSGGASAPAFQFRPFQVTVDTDSNGFVPGTAQLSLVSVAGAPPHALLLSLTKDKLSIDWKPDFLKTVNSRTPATKSNEFLVLHRTGNNDIRSGLNTFLNPANAVSIHYVIDVDGHAIKLAHESDVVNHTGAAFWQGKTNINATSVGIQTTPFERITRVIDAPGQRKNAAGRVVPRDLHVPNDLLATNIGMGRSDLSHESQQRLVLWVRKSAVTAMHELDKQPGW